MMEGGGKLWEHRGSLKGCKECVCKVGGEGESVLEWLGGCKWCKNDLWPWVCLMKRGGRERRH